MHNSFCNSYWSLLYGVVAVKIDIKWVEKKNEVAKTNKIIMLREKGTIHHPPDQPMLVGLPRTDVLRLVTRSSPWQAKERLRGGEAIAWFHTVGAWVWVRVLWD